MMDADRVSVSIAGKSLLSQVSLQLRAGELLAIAGPNGAGKSTLVHVMAGIQGPSSGAVTLEGVDLRDWRSIDLARKRTVLLQSSELRFGFSALEVVLLGRTPHRGGGRSHDDYEIAAAALEIVDATHFADRDFRSLSGGEKQRVQLARCLAQIWDVDLHRPRYLLLDEPTSALDLKHQEHILTAASSYASRGAAVLAILHDLNLAARFADRIAVMCNGCIEEIGPPDAVLRPDLIRSVFGVDVKVIDHPHQRAKRHLISLGTTV